MHFHSIKNSQYVCVYFQLVPLGLFELHCDEIVRSLAKRAEAICQQLFTRMAQENQKLNQEWVHIHTDTYIFPHSILLMVHTRIHLHKFTYIHTHTQSCIFTYYVHAYQSIALLITIFNLPKIILNFRIRKEYEVITDKALTTPTNTQHLMELKEFMVKAENESLVDLEQRMAIAKHR